MEKKAVMIPAGAAQPRLLRLIWICCVLALLCGIPPVLALTDAEYRQFLVQKLLTSGVSSGSAVGAWSLVNGAVSVLCVVCPCLLACGLSVTLCGKPARGFGFLASVGAWGLRIVKGTGIVLAAVYVVKAVLYVISAVKSPQGVMLIYSMVMMEGVMGVLAWFLFLMARRFAEGFGDAMASMAYTLSSGRIDNLSIPASAERGFLALGIVCPLWAVSQTVTVTIVVNHIRSYYSLIFASHPMEWLTAATLVLNGVASILMCQYLRRYNRICEWEKYQATKRK